jgi:hypothetical protein
MRTNHLRRPNVLVAQAHPIRYIGSALGYAEEADCFDVNLSGHVRRAEQDLPADFRCFGTAVFR